MFQVIKQVQNSVTVMCTSVYTYTPVHLHVFASLSLSLFFFWLNWIFLAARRLSLVAPSKGYSLLRFLGFSSRSTVSRRSGFSSCSTRAQ